MSPMDPQTLIARRVAQELRPGMLVNLGAGIPAHVSSYVPAGARLHSRSGNGPNRTVHPDVSVLGGLQVDGRGLVASMGGAMDLVSGARRVIVAMRHTAMGAPKIVERLTLPLSWNRPVDLVVTELAVIAFENGKAILRETAPGVPVQQVLDATGARLDVSDEVMYMQIEGVTS